MRCEAPNLSGYWKGIPCRNEAKFTVNGRGYCVTHAGVAQLDPARFETVKRQWEKSQNQSFKRKHPEVDFSKMIPSNWEAKFNKKA